MFDPEASLLSGGAVCWQAEGGPPLRGLEEGQKLIKVWLTSTLLQLISGDKQSSQSPIRQRRESGVGDWPFTGEPGGTDGTPKSHGKGDSAVSCLLVHKRVRVVSLIFTVFQGTGLR